MSISATTYSQSFVFFSKYHMLVNVVENSMARPKDKSGLDCRKIISCTMSDNMSENVLSSIAVSYD
jgi:hypothetical protein